MATGTRTRANGTANGDGTAAAHPQERALEDLLRALQASADGDFSVRLRARKGTLVGDLAAAFNALNDRNARLSKELVRVGRTVGREGRMTERASLGDAGGSWATTIDAFNDLVEDLARPTSEVARVITAVAQGDLTQKMALEIEGLPVKGEFLRIRTAVNTMLDQLSAFSEEVSRVAKEVGTDGKLGGQATVKGVSGTWRDLTDNVNFMARNLTDQVRNIALVTTAVAKGDLTQKISVDARGEVLELKNTINTMVDQLSSFADEVTRVAREVGTEGKLGGQAEVKGVSGTWRDLTDNVNFMAGNLTTQVRNIAQVATAVARGDLTQKITVDAKGEVAALADTINSMTDTLRAFADEVTRVAREVGTEGRLGGQAQVEGVAGTWKDLTDSVNVMAGNLTTQVRNIAFVATAVAEGDLNQKVTVDAKGEVATLADTINSMTDTLRAFADEVTRVAREVGTEGRLGGQAQVEGVAGTWKDLTDSVNSMAGNLTDQVRDIAQVTTAVANGDLTQKISVDVKGEILELKNTINTMVDQLGSFADEVTRVAREVGTEGILGGQAEVKGVSGTWRDLTENVNFMAGNLTSQVRSIATVSAAVAQGDLTQKITVDAKGEVAALADTINSMTDTLRAFADEVTRVAREVGTEGILGGQAEVEGVAGTWKDLTDSVNSMAGNLTGQVRNIAQVTTAVANGDLSQKISVDVKGEMLELKNTINTMVDQLSSFADEVTRVAREVGTEGKLGGQAEVKGVSGTWRDLTDNVNFMAGNLTTQVRNIATVATAVAEGDLTQKITVDAKGEVAALADTINTMVDQLSSFADEVTRVAREVGTEGILGGQAQVVGVSGTWKDLTDNVNFMAGNLTSQVRNIAQVTTAVAKGDLTQKITVDARGEILALKSTVNTMVDQLSSFADEVTRVAREVGSEGKLGGQAEVKGVSGTWKDLTDNVNSMAGNLTGQVRNIAQVATAVAKGDLTQKISVDVKGEMLELKNTINTMVDQLSSFAAEVTRVAREVGTEGILGGQAEVEGVSGTWRGLTENVNFMAGNLTSQVRNIAQVTTAVANGDLSKKITVDAQGEILELKDTINTMVDQLSSFADEVTRVAREVGTEGKLGGQAQVEGVSGTWKGLTENVNQLAANLTNQVRAIAEVSTAVTQGDLTRSIAVEAEGEVAELSENINQMIANLRETTRINAEQDWLKTNLARISGRMQGQRDLQTVSELIMSELTPVVSAQHGAFFLAGDDGDGKTLYRLIASYGYKARKNVANIFSPGEGLVGQAALERKPILITEAPEDYIRISSGLGEAAPVNIIVVPVLFEDQVLGVIELASFARFSDTHQAFLDQLIETIGVVLNTIIANRRTEELLEQSQRLTGELQSQSEELQTQQEELQQTNEELEEKAALLAEQNRNIEVKNAEIEQARLGLEEKAQQLALSSKYKSEFLANMSHELRTPLNSLLILAKLLSDNSEANLSPKQVEFARTIHNAGRDLLALISDILDLSKVEAGKMDVHAAPVRLADVAATVEASFRPLADAKGLDLSVEVEAGAPDAIVTDEQRMHQVLKNLLSNAVKFTDAGSVSMRIGADGDRIAFTVTDTGIGIAREKLMLIFESFQQADGTTSRRYGGTGLGLSISREIAKLLGGEIRVSSTEGKGSTFTLYLPVGYVPSESLVLTPSDGRVLLAVTPDDDVARLVITAGEARGFTVVRASDREGAIALAEEHEPDAVLLDASVGDAPALVDALKRDPDLRAAPVHVLGDCRQEALVAGALACTEGPIDGTAVTEAIGELGRFLDRATKALLVVDDDDASRAAVAELLGGPDVSITTVGSSEEALEALAGGRFDCMVLDLKLPKMSGFALLEKVKTDPALEGLPVIIHTGQALTRREETRLQKYAQTIVVKDASSPERLLDEASLYLHRPPVEPVAPVAPPQATDDVFAGKRILVVDDDVRNVFALTSALEGRGMEVRYAENGRDALESLEADPRVDLILMDVMMPEMDGYQTTRAVRGMPGFDKLPIIALTAKAMKGDREKSIAAGASDYITKPVDIDQLLSLMRVWLYR